MQSSYGGVAIDEAEKDETLPLSREKNPAPETVSDFGPWMMVQKNTKHLEEKPGWGGKRRYCSSD